MNYLVVILLVYQSLSVRQVIPPDREGLLKGEGMGMALPAEANGFPGPKHVLELKEQLGLTPDQIEKTQALVESVKASATTKGEHIVKAEEELHRMFASGNASEKNIERQLRGVAAMRGELRFVHLRAHLRMTDILTSTQIKRYRELRGHASKH